MITKVLTKAVLLATTVSMVASAAPVSVFAQDYNQPPPGYQQGQDGDPGGAPPPGYDQGGPPPGYDQNGPPPGYNQQSPPPPSGYDGASPPPPPPGYNGQVSAQQQQEDQRYARYAESWSQRYCVKAHGDVGAGAVIGGIFGAIIGSAAGGRGDRGGGALAGGLIGGTTGAVIASSAGSNATSPGCPPGYVVRGDAPPFAYAGYYGGPFVYGAPGWYRPWVWYDGAWAYRPYPYHTWYYHHYGYGYRHYR